MSKNCTMLLTALVALVLAACSQTRPLEPRTAAGHPTEVPKGPVSIPADALDKTLPAGVTGLKLDTRQFRPKPLPVDQEDAAMKGRQAEGAVMSYNLQTGKEQRLTGLSLQTLAALPASAGVPGHPGANDKHADATLGALNYSNLSKMSDTTIWPRSTNVKIFMTFPNGNQYVCSGQLYDPKWVITAGHCIYDNAEGGYATQVVVVPGYKNIGSSGAYPTDFHDERWGAAKAIWSYSYSGWRDAEDYDDDIGWLELDRPVGWLSGYEGFGYRTDCNAFTTPPFYNYSFPAETPYNGQSMYYRSGDFDGCEVNSSGWYGYEVTFNKYSYGGQSGSTFVKDGHILAVLSNGGSSHTDAPRLTAGKFNNMLTWRDDKKPDTADLVAMDVNTNRTVLGAGDTFNLDFLVYNYSGGQYYDYFGYYIYLSTNDVITPGDTQLLYHGFDNAPTIVNANASIRPWVPANLKVPACLPNGSGTYYLGIITYNWNWFGDSDATESNNRTRYNDTQKVQLYGPTCP